MATPISRTYRNAVWANEAKTTIRCQIIVNMDDGSSQIFDSSVSQAEGGNPDWDAIMEKFGVETIDAATTKRIQDNNARNEQRRLDEEQRRKKEDEFRKQEALFAMKLEAFEIEEVKQSTNRVLKAKIRKSKTLLEVQAYTTMLLMKEFDAANSPEPKSTKKASKTKQSDE
jgi:hypothetical protein